MRRSTALRREVEMDRPLACPDRLEAYPTIPLLSPSGLQILLFPVPTEFQHSFPIPEDGDLQNEWSVLRPWPLFLVRDRTLHRQNSSILKYLANARKEYRGLLAQRSASVS